MACIWGLRVREVAETKCLIFGNLGTAHDILVPSIRTLIIILQQTTWNKTLGIFQLYGAKWWSPLKIIWVKYTIGKRYGFSGKHNAKCRIWHFDLLEMAPKTTTCEYCYLYFNYHVYWCYGCYLQCLKLNTQIIIYINVSFFIISPKISSNFRVIDH